MGTKAKARQTQRRELAKTQRADSRLRRAGRYGEALAIKLARRQAVAAAKDKIEKALAAKEAPKVSTRKPSASAAATAAAAAAAAAAPGG